MSYIGSHDLRTIAQRTAVAATAFRQPIRSSLQRFVEELARWSPDAAICCLENAISVLSGLNGEEQADLLSWAMELAKTPRAAKAFFIRGLEIIHSLRNDELKAWIAQGQAIARENPNAGEAFFLLESQTSRNFLERFRQAVRLGDVITVLHLYVKAMAGKPIGVKSVILAPSRLSQENQGYPVTDGQAVFLPPIVDKHSSWRANFDEYKAMAAHQCGYIEFGTFDLDVLGLRNHPEAATLSWSKTESRHLATHYEAFFNLFEDPIMARDIFQAVEDARVDHLLKRKYAGLTPLLTDKAGRALADRQGLHELLPIQIPVEILLRTALNGRRVESLPEPYLSASEIFATELARVLSSDPGVEDSAITTIRIYKFIRTLPGIKPDFELDIGGLANLAKELYKAPGPHPQLGQRPSQPEYKRLTPIAHRGIVHPGRVQFEQSVAALRNFNLEKEGGGAPFSQDIIDELNKRGGKLVIKKVSVKASASMPGVLNLDLAEPTRRRRERATFEDEILLADLKRLVQQKRAEVADDGVDFYYDEWDYLIGDYRPNWCRVTESILKSGNGELARKIKKERLALISKVQRHFQRIRPESLCMVNRLPSGEDFDLDSTVESVVERRTSLTPSELIYQRRERKGRDVATAFLLDLSASTRKFIKSSDLEDTAASVGIPKDSLEPDPLATLGELDPDSDCGPEKRVIDIEREALVVLATALEGLGDLYGIFGFSSYGPDNVEYLIVKNFNEKFTPRVQGRIENLKPRTGTRMGPAVRHTTEKLVQSGCRLKVLILLSDGYPQDFEYGPDRNNHKYGLLDTAKAIEEARRKGIHPYMVTVDLAGHDYLHELCSGKNYLVVTRPGQLPQILPKVYRGLTF